MVEEDQFVMRPSEEVVEWKIVEVEEMGKRETVMPAPGRPVVVSRTWQVMGSRGGVAMVVVFGERWEEMMSSLC